MAQNETQPVTVLIAAPYASARAGLRALLGADAAIDVVGDVSSAADLARYSSDLAPDVILIDFVEPDGSLMVDAAIDDGAAIVIVGALPTELDHLPSLAANGAALLMKEADALEIAGAIRSSAAGLVTLDRSLAVMLSRAGVSTLSRREPSSGGTGEALSSREREVLQLLAQGLPNKQIAARLAISQHTAKFHVASILAKLGAASRTEAVTLGARRGDVIL